MRGQAYATAALVSIAAALGVAGWTTGQPLSWYSAGHWRISAIEQGLCGLAFLFFTIHCFARPPGPRPAHQHGWFVAGLFGSSMTALVGLGTFTLILHHVRL